ncbi:MAG TPA: HAD hydrolase-like protein [Vicinamibacteria bacterium]|jgi:phosphoglycolate phosphatase-like HAD superfamily hydrolase
MSNVPAAAKPLADLRPQRPFFVGIDSDGCAFDSMEIKHKECFCPNTIKWWDLQSVSKYAREAAEFVNLYSKWRGINRWPALTMVFDLLQERAEVKARGARITEAKRVREFMASGKPLSDAGLTAYMAEHPDPELDKALGWSKAVNASVADMVHGVPPFPYMRESLQSLQSQADVVVVSATPTEALVREWEEHDIAKYVRVIAGQEMGSKKQHLAWAAKDKYPADRILMVGDAPGDMDAAKANGVLFFPINPGQEEKSWERFYQEGLARFTASRYAGEYEAALIAEFETFLPSTPPWKK